MRTFTSYVSEYDGHQGSVPMAKLPRDQQDELIRLIFNRDGDYQRYVMEHDVEHYQPDGLWTLVVAAGMYLERKGVIRDFSERTDPERDWIINLFAPTSLWLRLEETFPPFNACLRITDYDWSELETFSAKDAIADLDGDDLRSDLLDFLTIPPSASGEPLFRLPYQQFHNEWNEGRLVIYVDRGMAVQAYRLSDSVWSHVLPWVFLGGLAAFIPVALIWSVWLGVLLLVGSIAARKLLTAKAVEWVRNDALASRERFRWYSARQIVWGQRRRP